MRKGKEAHWDFLMQLMEDPKLLLSILDKAGVWRVGLVNYVSPDVMGFTDSTNTFVAKYAAANPERLMPYGGVHPRHSKSPAKDVDRLVDMGIKLLKIHPSHMLFPANAYTEGLDGLADVYRQCEARGLPVMVHTGTSIFPGARSKWGNPMELDDVAIDFPDLRIVMAHGGRPLWMEEAFFILRRHKNVWLDVSGIPPLKLLEYFPRLTELADKVLWGTDWPSPGVKDLRQNIEQFLSVPLSDEHRRAILETNSLRLFPAA
jgi:predicted TIM-barrel fold metal-dependent hydrolase